MHRWLDANRHEHARLTLVHQCCYLLFLLPRHSDNSSNIFDLRHKIILSDYVAYDKYTALEVETQLDVQNRSRNCMFCSPSTCSHLSNLSNWTVYTEVGGEGPRCFIGGTTQFVRAGGSPVPVEDVCTGDQLEDPGTPAHVEAMTPNVSYRGTQVVLTIKIYEAVAFVRITHDHRMAMQNGDYRRAHEVKVGDYLCTSDGECEVIATREVSDETPVFEIYFQEDRSVFMVCCDDVSANVAAWYLHILRDHAHSPARYFIRNRDDTWLSTGGVPFGLLRETLSGGDYPENQHILFNEIAVSMQEILKK